MTNNWSCIHNRCHRWCGSNCWNRRDDLLRGECWWDLRFFWQFIVINSHVFVTFSPRVHIKVAVGSFLVSRVYFCWSHPRCPCDPYLVLFVIPPVSWVSMVTGVCVWLGWNKVKLVIIWLEFVRTNDRVFKNSKSCKIQNGGIITLYFNDMRLDYKTQSFDKHLSQLHNINFSAHTFTCAMVKSFNTLQYSGSKPRPLQKPRPLLTTRVLPVIATSPLR